MQRLMRVSVCLFLMCLFFVPGVFAQPEDGIPEGMPLYGVNRTQKLQYVTDSAKVYFGSDFDVKARWNDGDGWFTFVKRGDSLFRRAPTVAGYRDPSVAAEYFNEFFDIDTSGGKWNRFRSFENAGQAVIATDATIPKFGDDNIEGGGVLMIGNQAPGDSSVHNLQLAGESFMCDSAGGGLEHWYVTRLRPDDSTGISITVGMFGQEDDSLRNGNASYGIYFEKLQTGNTWSFNARRAGVTTSKTFSADIISANDSSWHTLGYYADALGNAFPFIDGIGYLDSVLAKGVPYDSLLTLSFEVGSGDSVYVDFARVIQTK